ncbi:hypothetical protein ACFH04_01575 [Streptomyces noboritoensis]|uniref:Uncharacterized protein n=1 Tax=Streptomyces noboritoensis TaxID=67337 RepID=A0ABV6T9G2_9ACTN
MQRGHLLSGLAPDVWHRSDVTADSAEYATLSPEHEVYRRARITQR